MPAIRRAGRLTGVRGGMPDPNPLTQAIPIAGMGDAAGAGAAVRAMGLAVGLPSLAARRLEIAVRELATNIAKHAGDGMILLHGFRDRVTVLAVDDGPGIADVTAACRDRHDGHAPLGPDSNWAQGLGCGLGAVHRLMDRVEIHSAPGEGTLILATQFACA
jgi:anti-sigma regulatory factor (Ser/Thr protein kinase)